MGGVLMLGGWCQEVAPGGRGWQEGRKAQHTACIVCLIVAALGCLCCQSLCRCIALVSSHLVSAALYSANPGLAKLLFALVFPVGLTMNTLHGTGAWRCVLVVFWGAVMGVVWGAGAVQGEGVWRE